MIGKSELFFGFLKIGMLGFGGVAPWARHVIVEERQWLSEREFVAVLGLGQILPGPNTVNASIIIGDRFQGVPGVLLCLVGQMLAPVIIVIAFGAAYAQCADVPWVAAALIGAAAGAAGLVMGTALKMTRRIKPAPLSILVAATAFTAIGIMQWPLVPVVIGLVPLGIGAAALDRRA